MNDSMIELRETFQAWLQQQVVNLDSYTSEPSQCRKIPIYYDDDDDEESSTPLRDIIISKLPPCISITPVLSTEDPKDSLIMGDEHLDTIPEKESNEFIKSGIENLVLSPSESEDISDGECDFPLCDDFPKSHLVTFSNPLFDIDNDFTASNDESFFKEDVPMENFKIFSNPLFDLDEEIISTEIDSLLNEFTGELIFLKSIPPKIDEVDCDPEEDIHLVKKLFDFLIEEIDLSLTPDDLTPPGIENDDYDTEGNILFLEEFLGNDSPSLPKNESFHFDVPLSPRPPAKPPDDGIYFDDESVTRILTAKVVGDISKHFVHVPSVLPTQPTLCPVIDTLLPFSSRNEDKVHLLSYRDFKAFNLFSDSPMMIYGGDRSLDFEESRALGFVLRSLDLRILSFNLEIQYPNLIDQRLSLCILNKRL
uniref:Reverse transcriptase domain-containing protein n=1 Tax=Tanacetum cinerariifolium TaxID=118510 RepID=A0A6L2KIS8_TANCI|nr:hypothetical protein [Tanacetum cinerariifolium]